MDRLISFSTDSTTMKTWSTPHLISIGVILGLCIILILCRKRFVTEKSKHIFRFVFAGFITVQQASIYIWYTVSGEWSLEITLPLQLCDLSLFLTIFVLITKRQIPAELLYFWGVGGALQAILTPDIGPYTYPHFVFYQYFISHGVILLTCIYMLAVEKFRPSSKSVLRSFIITNLYALFILPVNALTGGNYLFLSRKPSTGSMMDFLGPWPWYILSLEAVAVVMFVLLYMPFASGNKKGQKAIPF